MPSLSSRVPSTSAPIATEEKIAWVRAAAGERFAEVVEESAVLSDNERFTGWGFGDIEELIEIKRGSQTLIGYRATQTITVAYNVKDAQGATVAQTETTLPAVKTSFERALEPAFADLLSVALGLVVELLLQFVELQQLRDPIVREGALVHGTHRRQVVGAVVVQFLPAARALRHNLEVATIQGATAAGRAREFLRRRRHVRAAGVAKLQPHRPEDRALHRGQTDRDRQGTGHVSGRGCRV